MRLPSRRTLIIGIVLILLVGAPLLALRLNPGLVESGWYQTLDAGLRETRNNMRFLVYLARYLTRLGLNPEVGYYDFEAARQQAETEVERALLAYHVGDFTEAVELLETAIAEQGESEELLFWLANSHLRVAEAENCLATLLAEGHSEAGGDLHLPDHIQPMCTIPLVRHHMRKEHTRRAAEILKRLHSQHPDDRVYHWLLNFSHMALGDFPQGVSPDARLETAFIDTFYGERADRLAADHADLVFEDRAAALHVATFDAGKGVAVEDFDGDGDLDIVTGGNFDPLRYYSNLNGQDFADRTEEAGFGDITQVHVITAADYDNDGFVDLFVGRPFLPFLLLRNRGDGSFEDATVSSGLLDTWLDNEVSFTWASAWGDADNDGDLDLFVARWGLHIPFLGGPLAQPFRGSLFFINEGGRFVDRTHESGLGEIVHDRVFIGAAWGDADNDGDLDLFISNLVQRSSRLLLNSGDAHFETAERHGPGFMVSFVDVDHDGQLEIFRGGFTDAWTSTAGAVFGEDLGDPAGASQLLRRGDDGRYRPDAGFFDDGRLPIASMGASYGDLDLDGCLDFYLGTGNPEGWFMLPNLMFRGDREGSRCGRRATNISMLQGFGTIQKGHGIVFFDFDDDGDQDIYSSLGGMWPGDRWLNQLFVNSSDTGHRWVKIRLRGRQTNRFGVGARITVHAVNQRGEAIVRTYLMDQKTGFGSPPFLAHIGLLDAVSIDSVEVFWPGSGRRCSYPAELDTLNRLDEAECVP
jgi:hypothetical protein